MAFHDCATKSGFSSSEPASLLRAPIRAGSSASCCRSPAAHAGTALSARLCGCGRKRELRQSHWQHQRHALPETSGRNGTRAPWIWDLSDEYPFPVSGENVASVLTANGKTWKAYMEGLPRAGYIGDDRFPYVKRHNPFAYYFTVRNQPSQRANIRRIPSTVILPPGHPSFVLPDSTMASIRDRSPKPMPTIDFYNPKASNTFWI